MRTVYIVIDSQTEISIQWFSTEEEAESRAAYMNRVHHTDQYVVVVGEES